jgi:hypothetical protein
LLQLEKDPVKIDSELFWIGGVLLFGLSAVIGTIEQRGLGNPMPSETLTKEQKAAREEEETRSGRTKSIRRLDAILMALGSIVVILIIIAILSSAYWH